ncbi:MAG: shikimate kinase [Chloroflexi bacterium]|nr:shikimate kinase [Chloroflexota bacterium]
MKTNIALIGFMGTGKTAVGKALARKLNKKFVEMDALIEHKAGKPIPDIFRQDGEIAFRELEIEAVKEISRGENLVIACGGGVVLNKINIDRLRTGSVMVYLTASPGVIMKRTLKDGDTRPLLKVPDMAGQIRELLKFRRPFYERAADIKVNTSRLDVDAVAEQIVSRFRENEGFSL